MSANGASVRGSAIAGRWYPGNAAALRQTIEQYLADAPVAPAQGPVLGLIAPHAGYAYSGPTAARAFAQVAGSGFKRVVLLGPLHRPIWGSQAGPFMTPTESAFRTPLGDVPLDRAFIEKLGQRVTLTPVQHDEEHSLEIEVPFLQVALGDFALVPVLLGEHLAYSRAAERVAKLARALADLKDDRTLLVCSTDLTHLDNYEEVVRTDQRLVDLVAAFDVDGLRTALQTETVQACGATGLVAVLAACRQLGAAKVEVLQYTNSGEVTGMKEPGSYTVGYMAAAIYG